MTMRYRSTNTVQKLAILGVVFATFAGAASAQCVVGRLRSAAGANPAAIQAAVDQFRADLGPNNGVGKSFTSGRREINWDGVPEGAAEPNSFPPDFFNFRSPRGAMFTSTAPPDPNNPFVQPMAVSSSPASGVPLRFGNINPTYSNE